MAVLTARLAVFILIPVLLASRAHAQAHSVDDLIAQLRSPSSSEREGAACALCRLPKNHVQSAVPALAEALAAQIRASGGQQPAYLRPIECQPTEAERRSFSPPPWARHSRYPIVAALRQFRGSERAVEAAMRLVKQEPTLAFDHRLTYSMLAELGPDAFPALERSLHDTNALVRYLAVRTLPEIDPLPENTIVALAQLVARDSGDVRLAAAEELDRLRRQPKPRQQEPNPR